MKHLGEGSAAEEIRTRLAALTASDTGRWGVMRVGDMMMHLRMAYQMAGKDPHVTLMKMPLPPSLIKFVALSVPLRWPRTLQTVPEMTRERLPPPGAFQPDKEALQAAFEGFVADAADRLQHPIFGPMRAWDWQRWGYLHADHHLRQFGR